jgi:hypothetical protein
MPSPQGKRNFAWEGSTLCTGTSAGTRQPCANFEVEGLDFCMHHMPIELLAEAEEITGIIRCRKPVDSSTEAAGDICAMFAVKGTDPPRCKVHGANLGSAMSKRAAASVIEGEVQDKFAEIMQADGDKLIRPEALSDPLAELLWVCAEMKVFKNILRDRVSTIDAAAWGQLSRSEEVQVRAEVILYERALERLANCLIAIIKLGIEDRLAVIEKKQVQAIEQALVLALEASGSDLDGQARARKVLIRELVAADEQ